MGAGVRDVLPDVEVIQCPVADGGEGLLDILLPALGGTGRTGVVSGPLPGQTVEAAWGYVSGERLAIIEMARAAGLGLVPEAQRDPRITTTFGVGELIRAALDAGAVRMLIGIGGSATNDGGAGMAEALGVRFLDTDGVSLARGGAALRTLAAIDLSACDPRLRDVEIIVASDVTNPLTGPLGASRVYGPQKGASPAIVEELDRCLEHYGAVLRRTCGIDVAVIPGGGAAGGLGAALAVFCRARIRPGIDVVLDAVGFDAHLRNAGLVITGEGRLDAQTSAGKAMHGILQRALSARVPVAAVVGSVTGDPAGFIGPDRFADVITLVSADVTAAQAMRETASLVRRRTATLIDRMYGHEES